MGRGRLTQRQRDYAKLVAGGMNPTKAMKEVGYMEKHIPATYEKLRHNARVLELIETYKNGTTSSGEIASKTERQVFWTDIMNDPSYPIGQRIKASEMLGRSECDFLDKRQVENVNNKNPVVLTPSTSPEDWEKQWEKHNDER